MARQNGSGLQATDVRGGPRPPWRHSNRLGAAEPVPRPARKAALRAEISSVEAVTLRPRELPARHDHLRPSPHPAEHHPAATLETSRAGTGPLVALANFRPLGEQGLQLVIGHLVETAQLLREHLEGHGDAVSHLSPGVIPLPSSAWNSTIRPGGTACSPATSSTARFSSTCTRRRWRAAGWSFPSTDCYRHTSYQEPIVALKSYILSPFVVEADVEAVVVKLLEAREKIGAGG